MPVASKDDYDQDRHHNYEYDHADDISLKAQAAYRQASMMAPRLNAGCGALDSSLEIKKCRRGGGGGSSSSNTIKNYKAVPDNNKLPLSMAPAHSSPPCNKIMRPYSSCNMIFCHVSTARCTTICILLRVDFSHHQRQRSHVL